MGTAEGIIRRDPIEKFLTVLGGSGLANRNPRKVKNVDLVTLSESIPTIRNPLSPSEDSSLDGITLFHNADYARAVILSERYIF
jgi:hypothetical protein